MDPNTTAKKTGDDFTAGVVAAPIIAALIVAVPMTVALPQAAVLMMLWQWYAVPAFAAPPIGLWAAFGLVLMGRLLTFRKAPHRSARHGPAGGAMGRPRVVARMDGGAHRH